MRYKKPKERRMHPRIPVIMQVSFKKNGRTNRSYTMNFSKGGMFLAADKPADRGEHMRLSFNIPGIPRPLNLLGEVKWSRKKSNANSTSGIGLEFIELNETYKQLIADFVDRIVPASEPVQKVATPVDWSRVKNLYYQGTV